MDSDDEDLLVLASAALVLAEKRKQRKRRWGVRPLLQFRDTLGEFHHLVHQMRNIHAETFHKYFRMDSARFDQLCDLLRPHLTKCSTRPAISPEERLAVTLRFLATGDTQQTISFSFRLGRSTVSYIIRETCAAIWDVLSPVYLAVPTRDDLEKIALDFERIWNFPHCLGAIDGKRVRIQAPKKSGSNFFNYKGFFSVVLLAVVDADYNFRYVDIGGLGRLSDGGLFSRSLFGQALEAGEIPLPPPKCLPQSEIEMPHFFIGDAAFPLKSYMQRPYPGNDLSVTTKGWNT